MTDYMRKVVNFENQSHECKDASVECLGIRFSTDHERRKYFLERLREGLEELDSVLGGEPYTSHEDTVRIMMSLKKWPMGNEERIQKLAKRMYQGHLKEPKKDLLQLWKDEVGFPHGDIEDILRLSDPPYYTACPNPFINDFIKCYGKPYDPNDFYSKEPFAADVTEGKNDPIYNAHSYHTKVPHKAIMRYILHYTEPGDIVFDGFCGTGMTGVAAQLCGDKATVESLGYKVGDDGTVYQKVVDENKKTRWERFSKLGARKAVLNDLSPAATFIAYNYNIPVDVVAFEKEAKRILDEVERECGWMYVTLVHGARDRNSGQLGEQSRGAEEWAQRIRKCKSEEEVRKLLAPQLSGLGTAQRWGKINYTVWSDVFVCPECTGEVVFWEAAVDRENGKVLKDFRCPHCGQWLSKSPANPKRESKKPVGDRRPVASKLERAWVTKFDKALGRTVKQAKQVPVLINYSVGRKRYEKSPDTFDLALIDKIEELDIPYWFPTDPMMFKGEQWGDTWRAGYHAGITHIHHFYTKRNLWVLGAIRDKIPIPQTMLLFNSQLINISRLNRYRPDVSFPYNPLSGTLYVGSQISEANIFTAYNNKTKRLSKAFMEVKGKSYVSTESADDSKLGVCSVDYIFTDPPFGGNLMYSELNFLWEAWLKVFTNNKPEAITNKVQGKGLPEYQRLMTECFKEYYRVLKPGRWMTVEFHNSKNSVWNAIQEALQAAGFVIADVRTLDKKQGSFKQVTSASAVKQDLIISTYKPDGGLEERFKLTAGTEEGVWDFVRTHLAKLPVTAVKKKDSQSLGVSAQDIEIIAERQKYLLYDRMVAFHVQRGVVVPLSASEFYAGLSQRFSERDGMYFLPDQVAEYERKRMKAREVIQLSLYVHDEASAILWLRQQLEKKPQTFQELHPQFVREIAGWVKYEKLLELTELLEQNFLCYDGRGPIPKQILSWMKQSENLRKIIEEEINSGKSVEENKQLKTNNPELLARAKDRWYVPDPNQATDLEKLREKSLLREFKEYVESRKRLKKFRLEAVRAGFKKAWQEKDYATIISVARKIPDKVLQEDPKLLMWYDQAVTRSGKE